MKTSLRIVVLLGVMLANLAFSAGQYITGGFTEIPDAGSDPDVEHVMTFFASEVRNTLSQGESCEITVDDVHRVEKQVVAGLNYLVTVSLKSSCVIPGGASESIIRCERIKVYEPLPHECPSPSPYPENPTCMRFHQVPECPKCEIEKCSSDRDDIPPRLSHCKPGSFCVGIWINAKDDPELDDVLDFAKIEAKSLLWNYGSDDPDKRYSPDNCTNLELNDLGKVESQIVTGINYRITFSLKSTCAGNQVAINCEEVLVYKPLEFACENQNPDNPKCMELLAGLWEYCSRVGFN